MSRSPDEFAHAAGGASRANTDELHDGVRLDGPPSDIEVSRPPAGAEPVRLSAAVRLVMPGEMGNARWLVMDLASNSGFTVGRHAAALCVAATVPTPAETLVAHVARYAGVKPERLAPVLVDLLDRGVLTGENGPDVGWAESLLVRWRRYGWTEAADHHLAAFDYPFLDYAAGAWDEDILRMAAYRQVEPDTLRPKPAPSGIPHEAGPETSAALAALQAPFGDCLSGSGPAGKLDRERLLILLSAVLGVTRVRRGPENAAPSVRRTSPSGGSRHPSEGYVCVFDVPGLAAGWYHFASPTNELVPIGRARDARPRDAGRRDAGPRVGVSAVWGWRGGVHGSAWGGDLNGRAGTATGRRSSGRLIIGNERRRAPPPVRPSGRGGRP
jgi:hypothetical protein